MFALMVGELVAEFPGRGIRTKDSQCIDPVYPPPSEVIPRRKSSNM